MNNSPNDIDFNFIRFIKFLNDNNVISVIIAAILSDRINEMTNNFFDGIILPLINIDYDNDGEKDISKFEDYTIKVFNTDLYVGKLLLAIVKFFIIAILLYLLFIITKKISG